MPTSESYALKVPKEQELLPKLVKHLSVAIPAPIKIGKPSDIFPYPFSIYKWIPGSSANALHLKINDLNRIAKQLASFLKELQAINDVEGPAPGQHNWWRGDHVSVKDDNTWLRARACALWKATFELCNIANKNSPEASIQKRIIGKVIKEL